MQIESVAQDVKENSVAYKIKIQNLKLQAQDAKENMVQ
jgi:hypothetical protein